MTKPSGKFSSAGDPAQTACDTNLNSVGALREIIAAIKSGIAYAAEFQSDARRRVRRDIVACEKVPD